MARQRPLKQPQHAQTQAVSSSDSIPEYSGFTGLHRIALFAIALALSIFHAQYTEKLHELFTWWSTRNLLQKETSFQYEQSMYYNYCKDVVQAPSLFTAFYDLLYDRGWEAPDTINALRRFNVLPEVLVGLVYRLLGGSDLTGSIDVYRQSVLAMNGLLLGALFVCGAIVSRRYVGGSLAALVFLANHQRFTRVYHNIPMRESWGVPLLVLQTATVLHWLELPRHTQASRTLRIALVTLTTLFLSAWQFAPFVMLAQSLSLTLMFLGNYLSTARLERLLSTLVAGFLFATFLQFANMLMITSLFLNFSCALLLLLRLHHHRTGTSSSSSLTRLFFDTSTNRFVRALCLLPTTLALTALAKTLLAIVFQVRDDTHIFELLRAKFDPSYSTFQTEIYLMAVDFQAIGSDDLIAYTQTLALPTALVVAAVILLLVLRDQIVAALFQSSVDETPAKSSPAAAAAAAPVQVRASVVYTLLMFAAMALLAALFMRLKCLAAPFLCLLCALAAAPELEPLTTDPLDRLLTVSVRESHAVKSTRRLLILTGVCAVLVAAMSPTALANVHAQFEKELEWDHQPLQSMMQWITTNTPVDAIFTADMATTAPLRLCTGRRVTNHPHYESVEIRERTRRLYEFMGQYSVQHVHALLTAAHANYLVIDTTRCARFGERLQPFFESPATTAASACNHLDERPSLFQRRFTEPKGQIVVYEVVN